ncbi:winged helix-turn-helix transcriptional regulator [Trinickia acidisoli]|uniref:winged helix-turn-helix transcriptional regulator n=1 Tax=Trinickia acidisoli TaxID=2767482 RepID=UPI0035ABFA7A
MGHGGRTTFPRVSRAPIARCAAETSPREYRPPISALPVEREKNRRPPRRQAPAQSYPPDRSASRREEPSTPVPSTPPHYRISPRVDYSATALGVSLEPIMLALCDWGTRHARALDELDEIADCIVRPVNVAGETEHRKS